ncbi:unnamed protein product, partial [Discosporangium mesarthrocarpum]
FSFDASVLFCFFFSFWPALLVAATNQPESRALPEGLRLYAPNDRDSNMRSHSMYVKVCTHTLCARYVCSQPGWGAALGAGFFLPRPKKGGFPVCFVFFCFVLPCAPHPL